MSCRGAAAAAILDNSTPFSPLSDRCPVSTLKDTVSTASRLQKALAIVESVDELPSLIHPDDKGKNHKNASPAATNGDGHHQLTFGNSMADPEDSILRQGWKNPGFLKKTQPSGFFLGGGFGVFGFFGFFCVFLPRRESF
jgi:hypothetical protein